MRRLLVSLSSLAVASMLVASPALADHGRHGGRYGGYHHHHSYWGPYWGSRGFYGGPGYWWGPPAYFGWWAPPFVVRERTIVREEPVYVEREGEPAPQGYWYYCQSEAGYYPDVASCPEPWIPVPPRPE